MLSAVQDVYGSVSAGTAETGSCTLSEQARGSEETGCTSTYDWVRGAGLRALHNVGGAVADSGIPEVASPVLVRQVPALGAGYDDDGENREDQGRTVVLMGTPIGWKGEPLRVTMSGTPFIVWQRGAGAPPVMLFNFDPNNAIYVGYTNNIQIGAPNTQFLPPGFGLTMDGTRAIYAVGPKGSGPLQVTPGGGAPFQLSSTQIQLAQGPATPVAEDASTPSPVTVASVLNPSATSASFTPPANSWLVVLVSLGGDAAPVLTISNTGPAITWSRIFLQSNIGSTAIYLGKVPSSAAVTVTVADSSGNTSAMQMAVRVAINANASQAGAGSNSVSLSSVTNIQGNITTTKIGSLVYLVASEGGGATTAISGTTTIQDYADGSGPDEVTGKSTATTTLTGSTAFGWTVGTLTNATWGALEVIP